MTQTILRGMIHTGDDFDLKVLDFLRDDGLNKSLVQLLQKYNENVVTYAPGLEPILLQDIIVAYKDGKLSEGQRNSVKGFIQFAEKFISLKIGVISEVEKISERSISSNNTDDNKFLLGILKSRFPHIDGLVFEGVISEKNKSTSFSRVGISSLEGVSTRIQSSGETKFDENGINDKVSAFVQKILSNLFMKEHCPEGGWFQALTENQDVIDLYIQRLLDLDNPLDKALLKTIPLDFTLEQQREIIIGLINKIFPDIGENADLRVLSSSLNVFPNIGRGNNRGISFGKSISEGYFGQIMKQENTQTGTDKFLTSALRRIIVPLRFLLQKGNIDTLYLTGSNDHNIQTLTPSRLEIVCHNNNIVSNGFQTGTLDEVSNFLLHLSNPDRVTFCKGFLAHIGGKSIQKIDMTNVDEVINKYVRNIEGYKPALKSGLSSLFRDRSDGFELTYSRAREIILGLTHVFNLRQLDIQAEKILKGDTTETEEDQINLELSYSIESGEREKVKTEELGEDAELREEVQDIVDMIEDFSSNEVQLESDIKYIIETFESFSEQERNFVIGVLGIKKNTGLKGFLESKYLESADLCTKMIHVYKELISRADFTLEIKHRNINRINQGFEQLSSLDQERFKTLSGISVNGDIINVITERVFGKKKVEKNNKAQFSKTVDGLKNFLLPKKNGLQSGTISNKVLTHVKLSLESFSNQELQSFFRKAFGSAMVGNKILHGTVPVLLGKTMNKSTEEKDFYEEISKFMRTPECINISAKTRLLTELFVKNYL